MVDESDDKMLLTTFQNRVYLELFIFRMFDKGLQTMANLLHLTQSFMNAEVTIIVKKVKKKFE